MLHRKLTLSVAMVKCLSFNMKTPNFLRELKYQLQNFSQSKLTIFGVFSSRFARLVPARRNENNSKIINDVFSLAQKGCNRRTEVNDSLTQYTSMSHGYLSYFNKTCIISPGFFSHAITEFRQKHVSSETDCVFQKTE